jgi:hypothetical protein
MFCPLKPRQVTLDYLGLALSIAISILYNPCGTSGTNGARVAARLAMRVAMSRVSTNKLGERGVHGRIEIALAT